MPKARWAGLAWSKEASACIEKQSPLICIKLRNMTAA